MAVTAGGEGVLSQLLKTNNRVKNHAELSKDFIISLLFLLEIIYGLFNNSLYVKYPVHRISYSQAISDAVRADVCQVIKLHRRCGISQIADFGCYVSLSMGDVKPEILSVGTWGNCTVIMNSFYICRIVGHGDSNFVHHLPCLVLDTDIRRPFGCYVPLFAARHNNKQHQ